MQSSNRICASIRRVNTVAEAIREIARFARSRKIKVIFGANDSSAVAEYALLELLILRREIKISGQKNSKIALFGLLHEVGHMIYLETCSKQTLENVLTKNGDISWHLEYEIQATFVSDIMAKKLGLFRKRGLTLSIGGSINQEDYVKDKHQGLMTHYITMKRSTL